MSISVITMTPFTEIIIHHHRHHPISSHDKVISFIIIDYRRMGECIAEYK